VGVCHERTGRLSRAGAGSPGAAAALAAAVGHRLRAVAAAALLPARTCLAAPFLPTGLGGLRLAGRLSPAARTAVAARLEALHGWPGGRAVLATGETLGRLRATRLRLGLSDPGLRRVGAEASGLLVFLWVLRLVGLAGHDLTAERPAESLVELTLDLVDRRHRERGGVSLRGIALAPRSVHDGGPRERRIATRHLLRQGARAERRRALDPERRRQIARLPAREIAATRVCGAEAPRDRGDVQPSASPARQMGLVVLEQLRPESGAPRVRRCGDEREQPILEPDSLLDPARRFRRLRPSRMEEERRRRRDREPRDEQEREQRPEPDRREIRRRDRGGRRGEQDRRHAPVRRALQPEPVETPSDPSDLIDCFQLGLEREVRERKDGRNSPKERRYSTRPCAVNRCFRGAAPSERERSPARAYGIGESPTGALGEDPTVRAHRSGRVAKNVPSRRRILQWTSAPPATVKVMPVTLSARQR
jgi:hypothetical protein